jgi:hypothetical protein
MPELARQNGYRRMSTGSMAIRSSRLLSLDVHAAPHSILVRFVPDCFASGAIRPKPHRREVWRPKIETLGDTRLVTG